MNLKECKEQTIKMWQWLSDHPQCDKISYFALNNIDSLPIPNQCFCCNYSVEKWEAANNGKRAVPLMGMPPEICQYCPINWGNKEVETPCQLRFSPHRIHRNGHLSTVYDQWEISIGSKRFKRASIYAKEIVKLALQIKVE